MKAIFLLIFIFTAGLLNAQIFSYDNLKIGVNVDAYYAKNSIGKEATDYDLSSINEFIDSYLNSYNYTTPIEDKIRLYNASITAEYLDEDIKGKLTLNYGDIYQDSYAYIYYYSYDDSFVREANAGFSPLKDLWVEGGIFYMPFSAEPLLPSENFLTSVSIQSGFEPRNIAAAKVSYNFRKNLSAGFIVADSYGISYNEYKNKFFGFYLDYSPLKNLNIKLNNFTGNVMHFYVESWDPYFDIENQKVLRIFNNATIAYNLTDKLKFVSGIDFIIQRKSNLYVFDKSAYLYSGFVSGRYQVNDKFSVSARGEYFYDKHGIFTLRGSFAQYYDLPAGAEIGAFAVGLEYRPKKQLYARLEMNYMQVAQNLGYLFSVNHYSKLTGIASLGFDF